MSEQAIEEIQGNNGHCCRELPWSYIGLRKLRLSRTNPAWAAVSAVKSSSTSERLWFLTPGSSSICLNAAAESAFGSS